MLRKLAPVVLFALCVAAAIGWAFLEKPHYESAQSGLGGDLVDKGRMLWEPEAGFLIHVILLQCVALAVGALGVGLISRRTASK